MADIVVDLGCADWGTETSVRKLAERFRPRVLFGFDPAQAMRARGYTIGPTRVEIQNRAAWVHDGTVRFTGQGTRGTVVAPLSGGGDDVECVDIASFISDLGEPVILKLDIEGAEYDVLAHLINRKVIGQVELLLVEWHANVEHWERRRDVLLVSLEVFNVPVEGWD